MKATILNLTGVQATDGNYGVEIEAEGNKLPQRDWLEEKKNIWRRDEDGSLRAGYESAEYVMKQPLSYENTIQALNELEHIYRVLRTEVFETQTSGIHVHLNVQNYTMKELSTLFCSYYAIDSLVTKFCGESREGNHFCLRGIDGEFLIELFKEAILNRNLNVLNTDEIRYASMNLVSLFKYGSVEFRAMRGTSDFNAIRNWVGILHNIATNSRKFVSPEEVVSTMSVGGVDHLLRHLLGDKFELFLNIKSSERTRLVTEGIRLIQPVAYAIDWNTLSEEIKNPFVVKPVGKRRANLQPLIPRDEIIQQNVERIGELINDNPFQQAQNIPLKAWEIKLKPQNPAPVFKWEDDPIFDDIDQQ